MHVQKNKTKKIGGEGGEPLGMGPQGAHPWLWSQEKHEQEKDKGFQSLACFFSQYFSLYADLKRWTQPTSLPH